MNQPNNKKSYFHNWWSLIGAFFAVIFFSIILFFIIFDLINHQANPYLEAVTYIVLPAFLIGSIALALAGAWRERKKRAKRGFVREFPHLDFNNPVHLRLTFFALAAGVLFLLFSIFGAYRAYEFSDSVVFCGELCHKVMEPEYTAYHNSPHARVACVQCHVGPGAGWYVKAKLSGLYQIYSAIFDKYHRPIETPVKNLRPAQQTCEQCHWPQQFFGAIEQDRHYFLSDEANTEWQTRMLMFVGGGSPPFGKGQGIHWHMNIKNKVDYIASDEKRQTIPWVRKIGPDGKEDIYVDETSDFSAKNPPKGEMRRMDCIDCHNRPSHIYKAPAEAVNDALSHGTMDKTIPFMKHEAVKALVGDYSSHEDGESKIRAQLEKFYREKYPDIWTTKRDGLNQSIDAVIKIYKSNFFPKMKVSWEAYPDNIGHLVDPGCFRCHDGKHKTVEGKLITNDCKACHNIISQGLVGGVSETAVEGLEFKHPEEIGDSWKEMSCSECHTGG